MLDFTTMRTMQRMMQAYQKGGLEALMTEAVPLLPTFQPDGNVITDTHQRQVFRRLIPSLGFPSALASYFTQALSCASDKQVQTIALRIFDVANALDGRASSLDATAKAASTTSPLALVP